MATIVHHQQLNIFHCNEIPFLNQCEPQPKGDRQHTLRKEFINVTHSVLRVASRPESPQNTNEQKQEIPVMVINGSTGKKVPLNIKSTDTIGKLKEALMKEMPQMQQMQAILNLALNGKPVHPEMTMCELKVKPGATFITYHKCIGG